MQLSACKATPVAPPASTTYIILVLSGVLFGMCISGNLPSETKTWFVFAGTVGLLAYLALRVTARVKQQTQQRLAILQVEERLDRHSHLDLHADHLSLPESSNTSA